jgi:glycosyltransferase involved in cell wall biosynthesis
VFITILTPAYNRAYTLRRLYESLENQTLKMFEWLIVDDGSSDETKEIVKEIKGNASFQIKYIYKNNGGKHTAINEGIKEIKTELTFIVDSDDFLTSDAVKTIYTKWEQYRNNLDIGSMWFLQSDINGNIVGEKFPEDEFISTYTNVIINSEIKGDKRAVYVTKARKEFPFPVLKDEKFIGEGTVHKRIGDHYKCVFINKVIYKGEYLVDGLSKAGKKMRIKNPLGGMINSKEFFTNDVSLKIKLKKMILFITYGFFAKLKYKKILFDSGHLFLTIICTPIAYLLYKKWSKQALK